MDKYIHNTSGATKTYMGAEVLDTAYYLIPPLLELKFKEDDQLLADIAADDARISKDGATDLSIADSLAFLAADDANYIREIKVETAAPSNNSLLKYNSSSDEIKWTGAGGVGSGRNSIVVLTADFDGTNVNTGSYAGLSFKPVAGADGYNQTPVQYIWGVVGNSSNGGTMDIRIVKKSDATVIGTLSWDDETDPVLKTLDVTANIPSGVNLLQVEGRRTSGTGVVFSSGLEVIYG